MEIQTIEEKYDALQKEHTESLQLIEMLKSDIDALRSSISRNQDSDEYRSLNEMHQYALETIDSQKNTIAQLQNQIQSNAEELNQKANAEVASLQQQLSSVYAEHSTFLQTFEKQQQEIKHLQEEISKRSTADVDAIIREKDATIESLKTQLQRSLGNSVSRTIQKQKIEELQKRIAQLEQEGVDQHKLEVAQARAEQSETEAAAAKIRLERYIDQNAALEKEVQKYKSSYDEANSLKQKNEELQQKLESLAQERILNENSVQLEIQGLTQNLVKMQSESNQKSQKLTQLELDLKKTKLELQKYQTRWNIANSQYRQITQREEEHILKENNLSAQIIQLQEQLEEAKNELLVIKTASDPHAVANFKAEIERIQSANDMKYQKEITKLKQEVNEANVRSAQNKTEAIDARNALSRLEKEVQMKEAVIFSTNAEMEAMRLQNDELTSRLSTLDRQMKTMEGKQAISLLSKLRQQIVTVNEEKADAVDELQTTQVNIKTLEKERDLLRQQVTAVERTPGSDAEKIRNLMEEKMALQNQLFSMKPLQDENSLLKKKIQDLEKSLLQLKNLNKKMIEKINLLEESKRQQ